MNRIKKIDKTKQKIKELEEGWKRTQADFDNYRKRIESERQGWSAQVQLELIEKLLPILDNFELAIAHVPQQEKSSNWIVGILHIQKQFENMLRDIGVEKIEIKIGDEFNPNLHEAIAAQPSPNLKHNQISKIVATGYRQEDKIIRPVKVEVAQ